MIRLLRPVLVAAVFVALAAMPSGASAISLDLEFSTYPDRWTADDSALFKIQSYELDAEGIEDNIVQCTLDGVDHSCENAEISVSGLADGPHQVVVVVSNALNGLDERIDYDWIVSDGFGISMHNRPNKITRDRWVGFNWTQVGAVSRVECSVDDEPWRECDDPTWEDAYVIEAGEHSFRIRAFDADENEQAYPINYTWTLERTPPSLTHNMPTLISQPGFELEYGSDDPEADLTCWVNSDRSPCNAIDFYSLSEDEVHFFEICAEDRAGNETCDNREFSVQPGASAATITQRPLRFLSDPGQRSIAFTSDAGATFECRVRTFGWTGWSPCSSPYVFDEPGANTWYGFEVRATRGGVTQLVPDAAYWFVGGSPFGLYFSSFPDAWTSDRTAELYFEADNVSTAILDTECSLDGAEFEPCGQFNAFSGLSEGSHEFVVRATSELGGFEQYAYRWQVSDSPGAVITFHPYDNPSHDDNALFEFTLFNGADSNEVQCKIDDGDWGPCTTSYSHEVQGLSEGEHTFSVAARDDTGVRQSPVSSYTWIVDRTSPSLTTVVPSVITTNPYLVAITASEQLGRAECQLDQGITFQCLDGFLLRDLSAGTHALTVTGWDLADNESETVTFVFEWRLPDPPVDPPTIAKPTLGKPAKPKKGKIVAPWTCADATCTVSAKIKLGKKTVKLKSSKVKQGKGKLTFKLSKSQQKWLKKKGKKKATLTVSISGASGKASRSLRF